jgi:CubicO group peptidase (beta-lactamase class C family)
MSDITIGELHHHTSGGWPNDDTDPMFQHNDYNHSQLIDWALNTYPALTGRGHYAYSNFGYCLLGRVIEKISGKPYARFIQEEVLQPCGITDMSIGGNTLSDRKPNEVIYNGQEGEDPYIFNIARMDSHGGWLATATDMARFLVHVDGFPGKPEILQPATLEVMTTPSEGNPRYACGWSVNRNNNWWHNGSLHAKNINAALDLLLWPAIHNPHTPWQDIDQF